MEIMACNKFFDNNTMTIFFCISQTVNSIFSGFYVEEAVSRDIPWIRLGTNSLVQLGYGINQMRFQATITCKTSSIAVDIACNKEQTKKMLDAASIPVANGGICVDEDDLDDVIQKIGFPIVIKPLDGNHGL